MRRTLTRHADTGACVRVDTISNSNLRLGELANTLWLLGQAAHQQVRDAVTTTDQVDDLIRQALHEGSDTDTVAASSLLDPDLIRHVHGGGSSMTFLLAHPQPGTNNFSSPQRASQPGDS